MTIPRTTLVSSKSSGCLGGVGEDHGGAHHLGDRSQALHCAQCSRDPGNDENILFLSYFVELVTFVQTQVMQNGQMVERGTHSELIELDGVYKKLVRQQMEDGTMQ